MKNEKNMFFVLAALLNVIAALLHLSCIFFGAPLFRFLGTEEMAKMYESGEYEEPLIATLFLTTVLLVWAAYALSGARVIRKLPFLRIGLISITCIYLVRGIGFPFLIEYFPENSMLFWYCSSFIVFVFGLIHLAGIKQEWERL